MSRLELSDIGKAIPHLSLEELQALEMSVQVAIRMLSANTLSTEKPFAPKMDDEGPGISDQAIDILGDLDGFDLTLADQALLAATILDGGYQQANFSSREINDIIEENGRPRVAHITSSINGLIGKSLLSGSTKRLQLTRDGRSKARGLISMLMRQREDAA